MPFTCLILKCLMPPVAFKWTYPGHSFSDVTSSRSLGWAGRTMAPCHQGLSDPRRAPVRTVLCMLIVSPSAPGASSSAKVLLLGVWWLSSTRYCWRERQSAFFSRGTTAPDLQAIVRAMLVASSAMYRRCLHVSIASRQEWLICPSPAAGKGICSWYCRHFVASVLHCVTCCCESVITCTSTRAGTCLWHLAALCHSQPLEELCR